MGEKSKIEWTDATFNPWIGCQKVSPGCDLCYAEALVARYKLLGVRWGPKGKRTRTSSPWRMVRRLQRQAQAFQAKHQRRKRVFTASLADVFDNKAPEEARSELWALIRQCPDLDFQLLTKRPENIAKMLPADWGNGGYDNVWLGTTTESQTEYDRRWPVLSLIPAVVRFISYEPALGPLTMSGPEYPDWLICGGESGHGARTMDPAWARSVRDQCLREGIAFFHKQWGSPRSNPLVFEEGRHPRDIKDDLGGKGGAMLDGRLYREFPV